MHAMYASIWPEVLGDHGTRRPHDGVAVEDRPLPASTADRRRWQDARVVRLVANAVGQKPEPIATASCVTCPA